MDGLMQNENLPPVQSRWMSALESREHSQIYHARVYARDHLGAGAPGHGQFLLIAKLAKLLDDAEQREGEMLSGTIESFDGPVIPLE